MNDLRLLTAKESVAFPTGSSGAQLIVLRILTQYLPDRFFGVRLRKENRLGYQTIAIDGTCRATCQHQCEPAQQRVSPV